MTAWVLVVLLVFATSYFLAVVCEGTRLENTATHKVFEGVFAVAALILATLAVAYMLHRS